jgi:hypothetical protein
LDRHWGIPGKCAARWGEGKVRTHPVVVRREGGVFQRGEGSVIYVFAFSCGWVEASPMVVWSGVEFVGKSKVAIRE